MDYMDGKRRKRKSGPGVRFVINGYVYHSNLVAGTPPLRYLGCVEIKRSRCKGRATLPVGGSPDQIRLTQPHNHPPDSKAEVKDAFMKDLKASIESMGYSSCTEIYEAVAKKYPQGAIEIPYKMVCARLYRWKKLLCSKYLL